MSRTSYLISTPSKICNLRITMTKTILKYGKYDYHIFWRYMQIFCNIWVQSIFLTKKNWEITCIIMTKYLKIWNQAFWRYMQIFSIFISSTIDFLNKKKIAKSLVLHSSRKILLILSFLLWCISMCHVVHENWVKLHDGILCWGYCFRLECCFGVGCCI